MYTSLTWPVPVGVLGIVMRRTASPESPTMSRFSFAPVGPSASPTCSSTSIGFTSRARGSVEVTPGMVVLAVLDQDQGHVFAHQVSSSLPLGLRFIYRCLAAVSSTYSASRPWY